MFVHHSIPKGDVTVDSTQRCHHKFAWNCTAERFCTKTIIYFEENPWIPSQVAKAASLGVPWRYPESLKGWRCLKGSSIGFRHHDGRHIPMSHFGRAAWFSGSQVVWRCRWHGDEKKLHCSTVAGDCSCKTWKERDLSYSIRVCYCPENDLTRCSNMCQHWTYAA